MKNTNPNNVVIIIAFILISINFSCKKQDDWLNAKRVLSDVTPSTLSDYQAILDNNANINFTYSCVGLIGTDNLYISDANFLGLNQDQQTLYTFNKDIIGTNGSSVDWTNLYAKMEYANIVLDGLGKINSTESEYNNVKGEALFYRALSLFTLSQLFCKQYSSETANTDLGIPVRMSSDVNILYQRGTLSQTYNQMIKDVTEAISLLNTVQITNMRPSRLAAYGLLARIYLIMGDYENARINADKAISNGAELIDFNDKSIVSPTATYPFPAWGINNPEILFFANCQLYTAIVATASSKGGVNSDLLSQYNDNDLRKMLYFRSSGTFSYYAGSYSGGIGIFCGIAANEMYLIRAECYARENNTSLAMNDLNALLRKRYTTGTFTDLTTPDADSALKLILQERRKELPFTENIRWEDLRRLNTDPKFQVTVAHMINGTTYYLLPNDPKYVLPIPDNEIQISHIQQNER